jgi:hypothetical protein
MRSLKLRKAVRWASRKDRANSRGVVPILLTPEHRDRRRVIVLAVNEADHAFATRRSFGASFELRTAWTCGAGANGAHDSSGCSGCVPRVGGAPRGRVSILSAGGCGIASICSGQGAILASSFSFPHQGTPARSALVFFRATVARCAPLYTLPFDTLTPGLHRLAESYARMPLERAERAAAAFLGPNGTIGLSSARAAWSMLVVSV